MSETDLAELYPEANVAENLVSKLRMMIASGGLKPGERINQRKIAEKLGITTTPLREALGKLEREGVVKTIRGLGVFVRRYSLDEVKDLYLVREVLEGLAARLCAERASEQALAEIEKLGRTVNQARDEGDLEKLKEKHVAFHELIAFSSGSSVLKGELKRVLFIQSAILLFFLSPVARAPCPREADHELVAAAIRTRDGQTAELAMRKHVAEAMIAILPWLAESQDRI